ncbi:hypothetical protein Tco_0969434 [Tanacetum coccineum]
MTRFIGGGGDWVAADEVLLGFSGGLTEEGGIMTCEDFLTGLMGVASDFGVVILELVTGKLPIEPEFGEKDLVKWVFTTLDQKGVDIVLDPKLDSCFKEEICKSPQSDIYKTSNICDKTKQYEKWNQDSTANVVADALSRKERVKPKRVQAMNMTLQLSIKDMILTAQKEASDESIGLQRGLDEMIEHMSDGALYYLDRIWVPLKGDARTLIINKDYKSKYYVHPDIRLRLRTFL